MSMRFNPPPGWPVPPSDWTPPPDWSPDPSWPPPPPGWQLWVPVGEPAPGQPAPAAGPGPTGSRRALYIAGAAAALVVVVGVVVAIVALTGSDGEPAGPGIAVPTDPPPGDPSEVCDPPSWDGEVVAEGTGPGRIPLDGLPDQLFFYLTFTYAGPDDGQNLFQVNTVVDGVEGGFIQRFGEQEITGSSLLRTRYADGPATELAVNTQGDWTIQIRELLVAPTWPDITEGGTGGAFMRVEPGTLNGPTQGVAEHDDYFSVNVYVDKETLPGLDPIPEQLVLSTEGGTTEFVLPADSCLVLISAEGSWTVTLP